jgi:acyl carrier protein
MTQNRRVATVSTDPDIEHEIRKIIEVDLRWPVAQGELTSATKLGQDGLNLDSVMIIEFGIRVEQRFQTQFSDEEILGLADRTVGETAEYLRQRLTDRS